MQVVSAQTVAQRLSRYRQRIHSKPPKVAYTSEHYFQSCMQKRNRHLADNSSRCICFLTEKTGSTFYIVNYASDYGITISTLLNSYRIKDHKPFSHATTLLTIKVRPFCCTFSLLGLQFNQTY